MVRVLEAFFLTDKLKLTIIYTLTFSSLQWGTPVGHLGFLEECLPGVLDVVSGLGCELLLLHVAGGQLHLHPSLRNQAFLDLVQ